VYGPEGEAEKDYRPLFAIDYRNDEAALKKWLQDTLACLQEENEGRARNQLRNISFYNGIHALANNESIRAVDYDKQPITMENRFVMNHILEFTLHKQARLMRFSPNINVFPWNNEYTDRLGARLGKKIIDSAFYIHDIDTHLGNVTLEAAICGESFLFNLWDPFAGDIDPIVAKAEERASIVGEFKTADGEVIKLSSISRVGDNSFEHPLPWHVLHEPKTRWANVNYVFVAKIKHIDEVEAEYSGLKKTELEAIKKTAQPKEESADSQGVEFAKFGNHVIEWTFYHKVTRFVPKGYFARFYNNVLIEHGNLPYLHGQLPCSRFTDYDDPTNAHGVSFYESLKLPSVMINNMMKVAYRSFVIAAYPKLIMQQDSCNMYSMANGPFVVEYAPGAKEPKIVSFNAVNQDFFPLSQHVETFMEKNSGTFSISRGGTVPNARAGSILNFYEEQEAERESSQIRKFNAFIEKTAKQTLSNFAAFAKPEDGRTIRVVGKSNQYKVLKLEKEDFDKLSGEKDVKVQRTTALSESKQGRIDQIVALSALPMAGEEGTGLFTREQILQMVEVADTPTFFEMSTAAAERAMAETEDLYEGKKIPPPQEHQALIVDWNVYFQFMQSAEFCATDGIPEEIKKRFIEHMRTIEFFLYEKAKYNLAMATTLGKNKYFPSVYRLKPTDLPLSQIVLMLSNPPQPPAMAMPPGPQAPLPQDGGQAIEDVAAEDDLAATDLDVSEQIAPEELPDALSSNGAM